MKKTIFMLILLVSVVAIGCDASDEKTAIRLAQERLLNELRTCDNKFGSNDYENQRAKNAAYCSQTLEMIDSLIREGYFKEDPEYQKIIGERDVKNITTATNVDEEVKRAQEELQDTYNEVIGEI